MESYRHMLASGSVREPAATGKCKAASVTSTPRALTRLAMPTCDVASWLARLDVDDRHIARCGRLLAPDEHKRAAALRLERDRQRYIVARGTLRMLLGDYMEVDPESLEFRYTHRGKPYLAGHADPVYFNVSHSEDLALYAASRTFPVGADIECVARDIDYRRLAQNFLTQAEQAALLQVSEEMRKREFLACWTRKEAVAKASGDGLALPFTEFEVPVAEDCAPRAIELASSAGKALCTLYPIASDNSYVACVAAWHALQAGDPQQAHV